MINYLYGRFESTTDFVTINNKHFKLTCLNDRLDFSYGYQLKIDSINDKLTVIEAKQISIELLKEKIDILKNTVFFNEKGLLEKLLLYYSYNFDLELDHNLEIVKNNLINQVNNYYEALTILENLSSIFKHNYIDELVTLLSTNLSFLEITELSNDYRLIQIIEDPYILYYDELFPLDKVDEIAKLLDFNENSIQYNKAHIYDVLFEYCLTTGNTYLGISHYHRLLNSKFNELGEEIDNILSYLIESERIIRLDKYYQIKKIYDYETKIASFLANYPTNNSTDFSFDTLIQKFEKENNIVLSTTQIMAVNKCLNSSFTIISGGPGSGKTTLLKAIYRIYREHNTDLPLVLAPTGRAVKRIKELTKIEALTIHSALKWDKDTDRFGITDKEPLNNNFIIIDEFSMVDERIFAQLLSATPALTKLLILGDVNQLPAIQPGCLLFDLINYYKDNSIILTEIFRTKKGSDIAILCDKIANDKEITDQDLDNDQITFIETNNIDETLTALYPTILKTYNENSVTVLSPQYKYDGGVTHLNELIQGLVNPSTLRYYVFRLNDIVMQLKNDTKNNIYNGDLGIVSKLNLYDVDRKNIEVNFDDKIITYNSSSIKRLSLAYATTIHKAQGSEFNTVIIICSLAHSLMWKKTLLYTAASRAKQHLYFIGSKAMFNKALLGSFEIRRTKLAHYLNQAFSHNISYN